MGLMRCGIYLGQGDQACASHCGGALHEERGCSAFDAISASVSEFNLATYSIDVKALLLTMASAFVLTKSLFFHSV